MSSDKLMQQVIIDILSSDASLLAIPPTGGIFTDETTEMPATSLVVVAENTGKSIDVLWDYKVTVTLERVFRGDTSVSDFETLWEKARTAIKGWYAIVTTPLSILASISHLTIEEIDCSAEVVVSDQHMHRTLTFTAFLKPA